MKDAFIYIIWSANMIEIHGGKLMSNARKDHQVLILQRGLSKGCWNITVSGSQAARLAEWKGEAAKAS